MRQLSPAEPAMSKGGAPGLRHRIVRRTSADPGCRRSRAKKGTRSPFAQPITEVSLTYVIVCQCKVVRDADLRLAVEAGARSLASACRATGAASDCGHCVFQVRAVVQDFIDAHTAYTAESLAQLAEVLHEAEEPARRRTA